MASIFEVCKPLIYCNFRFSYKKPFSNLAKVAFQSWLNHFAILAKSPCNFG